MLSAETLLPRAQLDADYTARATVSEVDFGRIIGLYQSLQKPFRRDPRPCLP